MMSSLTMPDASISVSAPSRSTTARGWLRIVSSSTSFFALSSWAMPITMLRMMIAMNSMFV